MDTGINLAEKKLALISEISKIEDSKLIDHLMRLLDEHNQIDINSIPQEDWPSIQRGIEARDEGLVIPLDEVRTRLANL